jgi:hypothetical protein
LAARRRGRSPRKRSSRQVSRSSACCRRSAAAWVHILGAFRLGMRDLGYVERANVAFAIRYADGQVARLPALANEPSSVMNVRRLTRRGRVPTRGARAANNSGFRLIKASNSLRLLKTSCFH